MPAPFQQQPQPHPQQKQAQEDKPSAHQPQHPLPPDHLTWTPEHEARLVLVQRQLRIAQARWSEEQDLWIDEVRRCPFLPYHSLLPHPSFPISPWPPAIDEFAQTGVVHIKPRLCCLAANHHGKKQVTHLENLKRKCLKAGKKKIASTGPAASTDGGGSGRKGSGFGGMLKRGSWKGKKGTSPTESSFGFPAKAEDGDGEDEDEGEDVVIEGEDDATEIPTSPSPRRPSISTLLKRTMSMGAKSAGSSRRNTFDFGQPTVRPSLMESPVGSYSSGEVKGKGKGLSRRGSGR
ncbi:MAG: hypothetical protein Q9184_001430 [Pyrenodesmia sp. 2 TL-2023]